MVKVTCEADPGSKILETVKSPVKQIQGPLPRNRKYDRHNRIHVLTNKAYQLKNDNDKNIFLKNWKPDSNLMKTVYFFFRIVNKLFINGRNINYE